MILPPYYDRLCQQNPAAYLVELVLAELLLQNFVSKREEEVDFGKLSQELPRGGSPSVGSAKELDTFLRQLFRHLKTIPPQEPFPLSQHGKELLAKMEEAHRQLSDSEEGNSIYRTLYLQTLPALIELREKSPSLKGQCEVHGYFSVVFMTILLELSGKPVSDATVETAARFSSLLNILGELMMKKAEAKTTQSDTPEEE